MRILVTCLLMLLTFLVHAKTEDVVGWAGCATHEGGRYPLKGGEGGRDTILYSCGTDMQQELNDAICKFDKVVLDGSKGAFTVGRGIGLVNLKHKSIVGQNNAILQTEFVLSPQLHQMLDTAHVRQYSTIAANGIQYTLSNGQKIKEECEFQVRQHLIDFLHDEDENFRLAGLLSLSRCEDIIIQNVGFQGPGAVDVSGKDLLTIGDGSTHIWIDHCDFKDGMDGNLDITTFADFITISWSTFSYSERSYMHMNSNLIGSSDNAQRNGEDCLNVTFQNCLWGKGCNQRMPMARFGKIHLLNCVYDCEGCSLTVNPRFGSEVLMEGCVWKAGVKHIFKAKDAKAYEFRNCIFEEDFTPVNLNSITLPYPYKVQPADEVYIKQRQTKE